MQTLVRRADNVALYLIPDSTNVNMSGTMTTVEGPPGPFVIGDHPSSTLTLHANVTTGSGSDDSSVLRGTSVKARLAKVDHSGNVESGSVWSGGAYTYNGSAWGAV